MQLLKEDPHARLDQLEPKDVQPGVLEPKKPISQAAYFNQREYEERHQPPDMEKAGEPEMGYADANPRRRQPMNDIENIYKAFGILKGPEEDMITGKTRPPGTQKNKPFGAGARMPGASQTVSEQARVPAPPKNTEGQASNLFSNLNKPPNTSGFGASRRAKEQQANPNAWQQQAGTSISAQQRLKEAQSRLADERAGIPAGSTVRIEPGTGRRIAVPGTSMAERDQQRRAAEEAANQPQQSRLSRFGNWLGRQTRTGRAIQALRGRNPDTGQPLTEGENVSVRPPGLTDWAGPTTGRGGYQTDDKYDPVNMSRVTEEQARRMGGGSFVGAKKNEDGTFDMTGAASREPVRDVKQVDNAPKRGQGDSSQYGTVSEDRIKALEAELAGVREAEKRRAESGGVSNTPAGYDYNDLSSHPSTEVADHSGTIAGGTEGQGRASGRQQAVKQRAGSKRLAERYGVPEKAILNMFGIHPSWYTYE